MHNHKHVGIEGISGMGKTYLLNALRSRLTGLSATFLTEVGNRQSRDLDQAIIGLLAASGDRFFRGGHPRTETFLLLALKLFDYEVYIAPSLAQGHLVIEDRGPDTIAIYQALILHPGLLDRQLETANEISTLSDRWRPFPTITFLLEDHFEIALERITQREGCRLNTDEVDVLKQAAQLYTLYARDHAERIVTLKRQELSNDELLQTICRHLFLQEPELTCVVEDH